MDIAGIGRVVFWEGGSLWLGLITGTVQRHSHHAIQLCLPLEGTAQFQTEPEGDWITCVGALITPDAPHAFRAPGRVVANILFEPESAVGRTLLPGAPNLASTTLTLGLLCRSPRPLPLLILAGLTTTSCANSRNGQLPQRQVSLFGRRQSIQGSLPRLQRFGSALTSPSHLPRWRGGRAFHLGGFATCSSPRLVCRCGRSSCGSD